MQTATLRDFFADPVLYRQYAALLLGRPGCGKSLVSRVGLFTLAVGFAHISGTSMEGAFAVEVNEVEALRTVRLSRDTGILLDEVDLRDRAQFPHMPENQIKLIRASSAGVTLRGRNTNVFRPAGAPRVFTSNARSLSAWAGLSSGSRGYEAALRRVWVFDVAQSLVPAALARAHAAARRVSEPSALAAGLLALQS